MSPNFSGRKLMFLAIVMVGITAPFFAVSQQLVRDLAQDWLEYNQSQEGFLPVDEQNLETELIYFRLAKEELDPFYLVIGVKQKATLFYKDKLIANLTPGHSSFRIDSLKSVLQDNEPFLTIYGDQLLPYLETAVYTQPRKSSMLEQHEPVRFANTFSNFVYTASTLILLFFVLLKVRLPELTEQYLLVHRSIRFRTIDELIYKISYLKFPNLWFLIFIASLFGYSTSIFMYFFPNELNFFGWNPISFDYSGLLIFWALLTLVIFVGIVLKFILTAIVSSLFGLNVTNIHFASSVRLILILGFALASIGFVQFVLQADFSETLYWIMLIVSLIVIEAILFFKLTLVSSHTLLYIIVYLCATEIIPVVFLFKLYTA